MRKVPLRLAKVLGERSMWYRWFGSLYILLCFVLGPLILFAFSFTIQLGAGGVFLNLILDALLVAGVVGVIWKIDVIGAKLNMPAQYMEPAEKKVEEA